MYANALPTPPLAIPVVAITMPSAMMFAERDDLTIGLQLRSQLAKHVGVDGDELESLQRASMDVMSALGYTLNHGDDVRIPLRAKPDNLVALDFSLTSVGGDGGAANVSNDAIGAVGGNVSRVSSSVSTGLSAGSGDVMDEDTFDEFVRTTTTTIAADAVRSPSLPVSHSLGGSRSKVKFVEIVICLLTPRTSEVILST